MKCFLLSAFVPLLGYTACLGQQPPPYHPAQSLAARKARLDEAVRLGGPDAASFCRCYGDLGVTALLASTDAGTDYILGKSADFPGGPKAIVAYWKSGKLQQLADDRAALAAVATHGRPVSRWMIEHHLELTDPDAFAAFIAEPCEYAYELRELSQGVAMMKAKRSQAWGLPSFLPRTWQDALPLLVGCAAGIGAGFLARRWRLQRKEEAATVPPAGGWGRT
jgi:hypothetical protein